MEVLICAATSIESSSCQAAVKHLNKEREIKVLRTGVGLKSAQSSLTRFLIQNKPDLIVSSGFVGAVTEDIPLHSWIMAKKVFLNDREVANPECGNYPIKALRCRVVSLPFIFRQNQDRIAQIEGLGEPLAVDMESAALAEVSIQRGIPFVVLRLVTDNPHQPLPYIASLVTELTLAEDTKDRIILGAKCLKGILDNFRESTDFIRKITIWSDLLYRGWKEYIPQFSELD